MGRKFDFGLEDILQVEKIEGRRSDDDLFAIQQQRLAQITTEIEAECIYPLMDQAPRRLAH